MQEDGARAGYNRMAGLRWSQSLDVPDLEGTIDIRDPVRNGERFTTTHITAVNASVSVQNWGWAGAYHLANSA